MNDDEYYINRYFNSPEQSVDIGRNIVLSSLRMFSRGRFQSYADALSRSGDEVIILDVAKGRLLGICISIAFASRRIPPAHVHFAFSFPLLPDSLERQALGAIVDPTDGLFWNAWLVPIRGMEVMDQAKIGKSSRRLTIRLGEDDAFSGWSCGGARGLVQRLGEI